MRRIQFILLRISENFISVLPPTFFIVSFPRNNYLKITIAGKLMCRNLSYLLNFLLIFPFSFSFLLLSFLSCKLYNSPLKKKHQIDLNPKNGLKLLLKNVRAQVEVASRMAENFSLSSWRAWFWKSSYNSSQLANSFNFFSRFIVMFCFDSERKLISGLLSSSEKVPSAFK